VLVNHLHVQAFRSLYDVAIAPEHFTVVVGANNAGKSNLGESFEFLAEVHRHGLEIAVNRKGGFENIAHRRMRRTKRPLTFEIDVSFAAGELGLTRRDIQRGNRERPRRDLLIGLESMITVRHRFALGASSGSIRADFAVFDETIEVEAQLLNGELATATVTRDRKGVVRVEAPAEEHTPVELASLFRGLTKDYENFLTEDLEATDLVTPSVAVFNPLVRELERRLGSIHLYRLTPLECRKPGAPTPNPELELHGGNLPAVVAYMQHHTEAAWTLTLDAMRTIVPGLQDIRTGFTHDRRLTLQFVEDGVGRPWTAEEISDGTIQSLALFAAVFDPRVPVSFIEEPENAVHPWIVRAFVDACRHVDYKQIMVTTHSPALIGYLSPAEVTVVWRHEGRSELAGLPDLDGDAMRLWSEGEVSTFDLVDGGWLRQTVPEGLH
jgi:predicted ATPase